jgi:hypothetical protein
MTPMPDPQTPQPEGGIHQWTFIKRDVGKDFLSQHGNPQNVVLKELMVSFELTTVSNMRTPDAFWDEISLMAETETPQEPSMTSTPKPEPLEPIITSTPTLDPKSTTSTPYTTSPPIEKNQGNLNVLTDNYGIIMIALIIIVILGYAVRKKSHQKKIPTKYCMNCGATIEVISDFCEQCGTKQER